MATAANTPGRTMNGRIIPARPAKTMRSAGLSLTEDALTFMWVTEKW